MAGQRDLRIDFLRGVVMFILIIVHIDIMSLYSFLVWERVGIVSGGEGFVILSGLVIGLVYGPRSRTGDASKVSDSLVRRSFQLYRLNLAVIVIIALMTLLPWLNVEAISTFKNGYTGEVFQLYPDSTASFKEWISRIVLLRSGPHQFQIMGLYVFLLALTPLALWVLNRGWVAPFLTICWVCYIYNWQTPSRITGAQFEYAFPLLTWQLTYFHALAIGFHRERIQALLDNQVYRRVILGVSGTLCLGFAFFAWNSPNPVLPDWMKLTLVDAGTFHSLYDEYFRKNTLGILRIVNYTAILIVAYYLLSRYWRVCNNLLGWYFVPVGQASLYAFVMHLPVILVISWIPVFHGDDILMNTVAHTIALLVIWYFVKQKFLFRWIPR